MKLYMKLFSAKFLSKLFCIIALSVALPLHPNRLGPLRQQYQHVPVNTTFAKKRCTVLLYGAARNDLLPFIDRNLMQLMQLGTNDEVTFLVHLDIFGSGRRKLTQRFIIYKNQMIQVGDDMQMDSGDPETLRDACTWGFTNFPSDMTVLILWNHGTGDLEPMRSKAINPSELYVFNPKTNLVELNRSIQFLEYIENKEETPDVRGICFDEYTGHFLTNHQVGEVLRDINHTCLGGRPLDILCCDACLMMGIGFAYSLKQYHTQPVARYLVGSQEVVLATGYPYAQMFGKLAAQPVSAEEFAKDTVRIFSDSYGRITHDYTQSAICLEALDPLYESIDTLGNLLIEGMKKQADKSVKNVIKKCSSRTTCTYFEEPSYKDLYQLLNNMLKNIDSIVLLSPADTTSFKQRLSAELRKCCSLIDRVVIANAAGKGLKDAHGISVYVADRKVYPSFPYTDFAQHTSWMNMLGLYLNS